MRLIYALLEFFTFLDLEYSEMLFVYFLTSCFFNEFLGRNMIEFIFYSSLVDWRIDTTLLDLILLMPCWGDYDFLRGE
jgi:hypothetical protein